jgi:hypothetical protein
MAIPNVKTYRFAYWITSVFPSDRTRRASRWPRRQMIVVASVLSVMLVFAQHLAGRRGRVVAPNPWADSRVTA